jgi:hypothetical protein
MMDVSISAKPAQLNRSKPITAREALASIWRCFAYIGAAAIYLLRTRHVRSVEGNTFGPIAVKAGAVALPAAVNEWCMADQCQDTGNARLTAAIEILGICKY